MPPAACALRPRAPPFIEPSGYAQHRPESTLLYQLVAQHYPEFRELRAREGRSLPDYVQQEFDAYLKCGRLEEGFLRIRCEGCYAEKLVAFSCKKRGFCPSCGGRRMAETAALLADEVLPERSLRQWVLSLPFALRFLLATDPDSLTRVLRTVYRAISGFQLRQAGLTCTTGFPGAVTLIQRFGSALNLNIHFHMIFLAGVYVPLEGAAPVFRHVPAPTGAELQELVQQIATRIGKVLEQRGLVERDLENAWLANQGEGGPLDDLIGHSITYRIAVGPRAGQKLFTLQTVPPREEPEQQGDPRGAANAGGFSLHAGLDIQPHHAHRARAAGSDGKACRAGAAATDAPDEVSWGVRAAQQTQSCGDAGASGCGWQGSSSGSRQAHHAAPRGHELDAAPEARLWHRDRHLHALRRPAQGDRQHRRARGNCEDPGASAEDSAGFASNRVAPGSAGASPAGTADLTPRGEIPHHLPRAPAAGSG
jgi:ribosomal protein S27E